MRSGTVKKYYETGELFEEQVWKNGVPDGETRLYYRNGRLKGIDTFVRGKFVRSVGFDSEGKMIWDQVYK
ncbi:MAG: toxin-antitoxin system YwqK family antitoxin [Endomicrobiales bacterium]